MIMCVLLCYPVSIHMSQLLSTGRPISSSEYNLVMISVKTVARLLPDRLNSISWCIEVVGRSMGNSGEIPHLKNLKVPHSQLV